MFSDKKANVFWVFILALIITLNVIGFLDNIGATLGFSNLLRIILWLGIYLMVYLGFYTSGFINLRLQAKFKEVYKNRFDKNTIETRQVEVFQDSFTIKPFRQNYDAKISIKPRLDKFEIVTIDNNLILLGQVYDFGIFRRHIRPILIAFDDKHNTKLKYTVKPVIKDAGITEDGFRIRFKKSIYGIKKLMIKDLIDIKSVILKK